MTGRHRQQGRAYALWQEERLEEPQSQETSRGNLASMRTVYDIPVIILFDAGASHSFVSEVYREHIKLRTD